MTVKDMRRLTKGLPSGMSIVMDLGDGILKSVCAENSQVVELAITEDEDFENEDMDFDDSETIEMLLLVPCNHVCELAEGEVNSQPELN